MAFVNNIVNGSINLQFVENISDLSVLQRKAIYHHLSQASTALKTANELINRAREENAMAAAEAARKAAAEKSAADKSDLCERLNRALIALNILAEESDYIGLHMSGAHSEAGKLQVNGDIEYRFALFINVQDWKVLDIIFRHGAGFVPDEINEWNLCSIRKFVTEFESIFK